MFGPVSGGHFNPVVSFVDASFGGISRRDALAYLPAQVTGCVLGAIAANAMFARRRSASPPTTAPAPRTCSPRSIATLGLMLVIFALARTQPLARTPAAVGAYIGAAYFFTSSASFANPAISDRADVLQHIRRDRARLRPRLHRRPSCSAARSRVLVIRALYPDVTPADAATAPRCHTASSPPTDGTVLFVCLHNAGRSQMSQALFSAPPAGATPRSRPAPPPPTTYTPRSSR